MYEGEAHALKHSGKGNHPNRGRSLSEYQERCYMTVVNLLKNFLEPLYINTVHLFNPAFWMEGGIKHMTPYANPPF